ncbi:CD276 antigen B7 -like protein 3 [Takifugu flavidus]|uniref:CD276 antigen B7-like protein 3 n=1 Tax=Takifugu flavidus TaxID=433684 RepID=A0A5C6NIQ9_9TELE|nr:CD276 antigen B7 -like protein 3 [Takifugu flavidus]
MIADYGICLYQAALREGAHGQNVTFPPVALWVTVGLAVCLFVLLIALAAVCRRKIKESCEEARREAEEAKELEEEESKTATARLVVHRAGALEEKEGMDRHRARNDGARIIFTVLT